MHSSLYPHGSNAAQTAVILEDVYVESLVDATEVTHTTGKQNKVGGGGGGGGGHQEEEKGGNTKSKKKQKKEREGGEGGGGGSERE